MDPYDRICLTNQAIDGIKAIIQLAGDNPGRNGLQETPKRVIASWKELLHGYDTEDSDLPRLLKCFPSKANEMVVFTDIDFTSVCEHHMLPFMGVVHVGYIPCNKIVGASKIPRLIEVFARRLQVQEEMTCQIADAIVKHVSSDVGLVSKATHLCMACRGVKKPRASMICSALRGAFKQSEVRSEFLNLAHSKV